MRIQKNSIYKITVLVQVLCLIFVAAVFSAGRVNAAEIENETGESTSTLEQIYEKKGFLTEADIENASFSFEKEIYHIIKNDEIKANVLTNVPDVVFRMEYNYSGGIASSWGYNSEDKTVSITGYNAGTTELTIHMYVTYCDDDGMYAGEKKISATTSVEVVAINDIKLMTGETYELTLNSYPEYNDWEYTFSNNNGYVSIENGYLKGISAGFCSLYFENKDKDKKIYIAYISVYPNGISFESEAVNRAIGSMPYQLVLRNIENKTVTWKSSDENVAKVNSTGVVMPVAVGVTTITAEVKISENSTEAFTCTFNVTNPTLDVDAVSNLALGYEFTVNVTGTTSKGTWKSSKEKCVSVYSNSQYIYNTVTNDSATVRALKKGEALISIDIDGVVRSFTINVTNPKLKTEYVILSKGKKQSIKVTGTNNNSVIKFLAENAKVVTVGKNGKIKAKKIGYTPVYVEVDRAVMVVNVNVGKPKAVKAIKNALKVEGAIYSQARRMQKGYYDCSSLVWRTYKPAGETFGQRHYAPVAATEAQYCVSKKKTVPKKYVNKIEKLRTGDLIFYKRDVNNGRYKNIYHVAIYMGQTTVLYGDFKYTYGRIIHANGARVSQGMLYNQDNCVVIGRPF